MIDQVKIKGKKNITHDGETGTSTARVLTGAMMKSPENVKLTFFFDGIIRAVLSALTCAKLPAT